MTDKIPFTKMHGCGNDYIYVNTMEHPISDPVAAAIAWSDRHKGIGSDGLVLIGASPIPEADYTMRIFNADGSEAMMWGNASRCIGKYLYEKTHPWPLPVMERNGYQETKIRLLTNSGVKMIYLHIVEDIVESITVDMGEPVFEDETLFNPAIAKSLSTPLHYRERLPIGELSSGARPFGTLCSQRMGQGGRSLVRERHRHRYEFNNAYLDEYEKAGMKCVGINPAADLVEIVEIPDKHWYIGTQFHPEYSSTVLHPHPLFMSFIKACI